MNKIDFAKINKKENMIMVFNQLKDDYSTAFQQIDQLTNNWNELEEIIRKDHEECKNIYDNFERSVTIYTKGLLDRIKEIKERNNV